MTTFDEFCDEVKGAARAGVEGARGGRDVTPMLHILTGHQQVGITAIEPAFFTAPEPGAQAHLVERFIVPMVIHHGAHMVALTFTGAKTIVRVNAYGAEQDDSRIAVAIVLAPDEIAGFFAVMTDTDPRTVGPWEPVPIDEAGSDLLTPIKEALRL